MQLNRHALRVIRQRSGLTVSALARRAGVSQPHLSNVERGRRQASPELIGRLAAALRVPVVALLAEVDDESEPGRRSLTRDRSSPGWCRRRRRPGSAQPQGSPMSPSPMSPPAPAGPAGGPEVQMPGRSIASPPGAPPRAGRAGRSRRAGRAVAGLASAGAVLAGMAPAHAETYYTGQCNVSSTVLTDIYYRTFQARISGTIQDGNGKYLWAMYDYKYTVDLHLTSGGSSDEEVTFTSGYVDGLSNPWHSPDNHGSSGDWIQEANWKGATSWWGSTKVKFHAAFDIPGTPDPHCDAFTGTV